MNHQNKRSYSLQIDQLSQHRVPKTWTLRENLGTLVIDKLQDLLSEDIHLGEEGIIAGQAVCSIVMELAGYHRGPIKDIDLFYVRHSIKNESKLDPIPTWFDQRSISKPMLDLFPLLKFNKKTDPHLLNIKNTSEYLLFDKPLYKSRACNYSHTKGKFHQHYLSSLNMYQIYACDQVDLINYIYCKIHEYGSFKVSDLLASFDINCTQVAVDLHSKKLIWTPAFEEFIYSFELKVQRTSQPAHTAIRWVEKRKSLGAYGDDEVVLSLLALLIYYGDELLHLRKYNETNSFYPRTHTHHFQAMVSPYENFYHWKNESGEIYQHFSLILGTKYQARFKAIAHDLKPWFDLKILSNTHYQKRFPKSYIKHKDHLIPLAKLVCNKAPDAQLSQSLMNHLSGKAGYGVLKELSSLPQFLYWQYYGKMTRKQKMHLTRLHTYRSEFPHAVPLLLAQLYSTQLTIINDEFSKTDLQSIESCYLKHPHASHKLSHLPIRVHAQLIRYINKVTKKYGEGVWGMIENEAYINQLYTSKDIQNLIKINYSKLLTIIAKEYAQLSDITEQFSIINVSQVQDLVQEALDMHDSYAQQTVVRKAQEKKCIDHLVAVFSSQLDLDLLIQCYQILAEDSSVRESTHYHIDQLSIVGLKTAQELNAEGHYMRNCIGGYTLAVAQKRSWIFRLQHKKSHHNSRNQEITQSKEHKEQDHHTHLSINVESKDPEIMIHLDDHTEIITLPYYESFQSFDQQCPIDDCSNLELKRISAPKAERNLGLKYIYKIQEHKGYANRDPHPYHQQIAKNFTREFTLLQIDESIRSDVRRQWNQLKYVKMSKASSLQNSTSFSWKDSLTSSIKLAHRSFMHSLEQCSTKNHQKMSERLTQKMKHLPIPTQPNKKRYWFKSQKIIHQWITRQSSINEG